MDVTVTLGRWSQHSEVIGYNGEKCATGRGCISPERKEGERESKQVQERLSIYIQVELIVRLAA